MNQAQHAPSSGRFPKRPSVFSGVFLALLLVIFLFAFGYASYLFFQTTRTIALNSPQMVSAQGAAVSDEAASGGAISGVAGETLAGASETSPISKLFQPIWKDQEPINILILGIDQRPGESGYYRTDTMILVNLDPKTGDIGMLSMPRDLWVTIPGFGEDRINTAHVIGDWKDYPGGGPALAKETVSALVGQPVHYYVRINFEGFRKLLEEIGCIDIDVPMDINDPQFPDDHYGFDPFYLEAGHYCMDADLALKYARTRHVDSDFGRMERQQQVILAIKNKVLNAGQLLQLLSRMPTLLATLSDSIQTDMPANEQITLANLARKLNTDNIRRLVIDRSMTKAHIRDSGAYVLLPKMDVLQPALASFFHPDVMADPELQDSLRTQLTVDDARISVLNGRADPDAGRLAAEWLADQGYIVAGYGDAGRSDYQQTQLIDYGRKDFTLQSLIDLLGVSDENIRPGAGDNEQVDIQIIVGSDFPLP